MFYYFDMSLQIQGSYLLTIAAFRIGVLSVTLFANDDFTNFKYSYPITTLNMLMDENMHVYFKDHDQSYSLVVHGMIRADFSNMYNFTVSSNKEVQVYFNQQLMIDKPQEVKEVRGFMREMVKHEMVHLEIRVSDREREMEEEMMGITKGRGYFKMWEECGNMRRRLIKNKNIF